MSALAHVFEAAGIATIGISSVRGQAERSRPPRMLHCDFPLGRPLGRPGDAAFQHRVLAAALGLLIRTDVPVLVDFDTSIVDDGDQPLACTLPPFHNPNLHPAVDEALGLRAAYERNRARSGLTNVGRVGDADQIRSLIEAFVRIADGEPWTEVGLEAIQIGQAGLDLRAYYEEAALALADHVPGARQAESWFFRSTEAGALVRRVQTLLKSAEAPRPAWFPLVPTGQPPG